MTAASTALFAHTASLRLHRDVGRAGARGQHGPARGREVGHRRHRGRLAPGRAVRARLPADQPYIVVSTGERELWYKKGDEVLFHTQVATGSGKTLVKEGGGDNVWKFETPRGRLVRHQQGGEPRLGASGLALRGAGAQAEGRARAARARAGLADVRRLGDHGLGQRGGPAAPPTAGRRRSAPPTGARSWWTGRLIVPPLGHLAAPVRGRAGHPPPEHRATATRSTAPTSRTRIGQAVSHGCVRLRNEDIEKLLRHGARSGRLSTFIDPRVAAD